MPRFPSRILATALLIAACLVLASPHSRAASWYKLSGSMQPEGNVTSFDFSPNGAYVVYAADQEVDEIHNLYSVPIGGGTPARLSDLVTYGGQPVWIESYMVSPVSSRVVFVGEQEEAGKRELYSVPIEGPWTAAVKLNKALPEDGDVQRAMFSPDGNWVVYLADQDTDGVPELYTVPSDGPSSAGVKVSDSLVSGGSIWSFQISPDSAYVVYIGEQDTDEVDELYVVPITGTVASVKLNRTLPEWGSVGYFDIEPDGELVVYSADQDEEGTDEIYSVPLMGPASAGQKLSGPMVSGGYVDDFEISPDSERVIYSAYQENASRLELYSVPIDGPSSSWVKLNGALVTGGGLYDYRISSDGQRVVYKCDQDTDDMFEIYSVPSAGPAASGVKLNQALIPDGWVYRFDISADGTRVVYTAEQQGNGGVLEVYGVPIAGPATSGVKLSGPLVPGGRAWWYDTSYDSAQVAYQADQDTDGLDELYLVPIGGPTGAAEKISGPMVSGGGLVDVWFSPVSSCVVYIAQQDSATIDELYAANCGPSLSSRAYLPLTLRG